ncbi:MAG TPA: DUF6364 family protein [bacterium]|nr:DUF6364 family protein [bacterium]
MATRTKPGEGKQNVTLSLDKELLARARVYAAHHGLSLTRLLVETLEERLRRDANYEAARRRAVARLKRGIDFGGPTPTIPREDLYDR